jgi:hypothetical protein
MHMSNELFVGIADNNHYSTAIVGDSHGRVVATGIGESVNFVHCGMAQARKNLNRLITTTVGWRNRHHLTCVCFTFKTDIIHNFWQTSGLVHGLFLDADVRVEKFSVSCTLGVSGAINRIVLVGGQSGFVLFEDANGLRYSLRHNALVWDLEARLLRKIESGRHSWAAWEIESFLASCSGLSKPVQLALLCEFLDKQVELGNPLALEVAYDMAHDLIDLLRRAIVGVDGRDVVVGLYGPVLLGSKTVYNRVSQMIELLFPEVTLKEAPFAPAKGAYLSSLLSRGVGLNQELMDNLTASSRGLYTTAWPELAASLHYTS